MTSTMTATAHSVAGGAPMHSVTGAARSREGLRDRNVQRLFELMDRRSELRGVHPVADQLVETVTWAV